MVKKPYEYKWSSARSHVFRKDDPILSKNHYQTEQIANWCEYIEEKEEEDIINAVRSSTRTGRPCGDDGFIKNIEELLGRRLKAMLIGRPRKKK